jgi:hypothetical protein
MHKKRCRVGVMLPCTWRDAAGHATMWIETQGRGHVVMRVGMKMVRNGKMPLTTFDFIFESGNGNRIGNTSQEN